MLSGFELYPRWVPLSTVDIVDKKQLLLTIHVYLTTGVLMCQGAWYELWCLKEFPRLKQRMKRLNANYGGKQVNETEHALNSVPDDFDISTCKNLDDFHQVTMEGKKKARKNTANCASSKSNADDCENLTEDSTEPEIKNLVDETQTPKSSHPKRSNSLSSVWSLSTKKNSSIFWVEIGNLRLGSWCCWSEKLCKRW